MNLENQVCSLELSKKLKELGVKQSSLFYWNKFEFDYNNNSKNIWALASEIDQYTIISKISAFTSDELFDLLPAWIDIKQNEPFNNFYLQLTKRTTENIKYIARYVCDSIPGEEINNPLFKIESTFKFCSPKLADCLAEMLIYLLENGMLKNE